MSPAEFAAIMGGVLALLGILGTLWKLVRAGYRAARRLERIEALATELAPNGGGSIKDTVHRIDARTAEHDTRLETLETAVEELRRAS